MKSRWLEGVAVALLLYALLFAAVIPDRVVASWVTW